MNEKAVNVILSQPPKDAPSQQKYAWQNSKTKVSEHIEFLAGTLRGSGRFREFVKQQVESQEPVPQPTQKPGESNEATEEAKSQREAARNKQINEECKKDTNLRLWIEDVLMAPQAGPSDTSELLQMWLWRYLYRVADAAPDAGDAGAKKDSQEMWSAVLKAASISLEGDLVRPWEPRDFDKQNVIPTNCQTLIATSRPVRLPTASPHMTGDSGSAAGGERPVSGTQSANGTNDKASK
jgi:hypothetical protein